MAAIPLVLGCYLTAGDAPGQRREDRRQLGANLSIQRTEAVLRETSDVLVERIDEHPERQVPLELRSRAR